MKTWYRIVKNGFIPMKKAQSNLYKYYVVNNLIIDESENMVFAFQSEKKDPKKTVVIYFQK